MGGDSVAGNAGGRGGGGCVGWSRHEPVPGKETGATPSVGAKQGLLKGPRVLERKFPVILGNEASFRRITGKFSVQRASSPILSEICRVFGTLHILHANSS